MKSVTLWLILVVLYSAALITASLCIPVVFAKPAWWRSLNWVYALAFLGFGVLLQGAIARVFYRASPLLWRPLMLCAGALFALVQIWSIKAVVALAVPVNAWMSALLGLALAALAARVLPQRLLLRWYGITN
jgi:hypothetical protein